MKNNNFKGFGFASPYVVGVFFSLLTLFSPSFSEAAEEVFYYHNDAVGSPVAMTDSNGAIVWEADYQPFGDEWSLSETESNAHRFTGKERDAETGLHYFGARYYDANLGRFISIDPALISGRPVSTLTVPQQHNLYAYAINNPYRYVDPDGEFAISAAIVLGAIATNAFLPSTVNAPLDDQNLVNSQTTAEFAKDAAILETAGFALGKVSGRVIGKLGQRSATAVKDILVPGGKLIGEAGKREGIRVVHGLDKAEKIFKKLTRGGKRVKDSTHSGKRVKVPGGGEIGFRPKSRSGGPAIDVNIPSVPEIRRIHFE